MVSAQRAIELPHSVRCIERGTWFLHGVRVSSRTACVVLSSGFSCPVPSATRGQWPIELHLLTCLGVICLMLPVCRIGLRCFFVWSAHCALFLVNTATAVSMCYIMLLPYLLICIYIYVDIRDARGPMPITDAADTLACKNSRT